MNYRIMHETERSLRLRLRYAPLGESEEALLRFRLQKLPSVRSVSFFRQTGGILISFSGGRKRFSLSFSAGRRKSCAAPRAVWISSRIF